MGAWVVEPFPIVGGMDGMGAIWGLTLCLPSPRVKYILCKLEIVIMVVAFGIIIYISSLTLILTFWKKGVKTIP